MNIVVINNGYPSESDPVMYMFVHKQVKALINKGHNVTVIDIDLRSLRWKRKIGFFKETFDGVEVYRFSFPFTTVHFRSIGKKVNEQIGKFVFNKVKKDLNTIDIIHSHFGFGAGNAGAKIQQIWKIPLIITEHSTKVLYSKNSTEIKHNFPAYKKAGFVITVGTDLSQKLKSYRVNNLVQIPNIIDTQKFRLKNESKFNDFTFLSVGHLIPRKAHDLTLKALKILNDRGVHCNLIIVGTGPEENKLKTFVDNNQMKNVKFVDKVKNDVLPELYRKSHAFVLPSTLETFGVVYAEAIACGIPVIAADSQGPKDIIDKSNGLIVEKNSVKELASAMEYMVYNAEKYHSINLHRDIKRRFGPSSFLQQIEDVYNQVIIGS